MFPVDYSIINKAVLVNLTLSSVLVAVVLLVREFVPGRRRTVPITAAMQWF